MQPVVHLAVGYLCYAVYTRWRGGRTPNEAPALAAILGAAIPDLIDKPIWIADIVAVGRTIGHSLLFVVPLTAVVWLYAHSREQQILGVAFAIGILSHVATDVPWHVISGDFDELGFLLWPVTPMPAYTGTKPLGTIPGLGAEVTTLWLEAVILVAGIAVWWVDGRPGIGVIRRALE